MTDMTDTRTTTRNLTRMLLEEVGEEATFEEEEDGLPF